MTGRDGEPWLAGALALAALSCASCAGAGPVDPNPQTGSQVYEQTVAERDEAKGLSWVNGPRVWYGREPSRWFFRALFIDDRKTPAGVQLYVADVPDGEGWAFYDKASDPQGSALEVIGIDRDTQLRSGDLVCVEELAVNLGQEYLVEHEQGFAVRIWGNGGARTLEVPGYYIAAFLSRLREFSSTGKLSPVPMNDG